MTPEKCHRLTPSFEIRCRHRFSPLKKRATARVAPTLGHIIGSFKSKSVKDYLYYIRQNNIHEIGKLWQRNYYERIIRNEHELHKIRHYIQNNPEKWELDKENPKNI